MAEKFQDNPSADLSRIERRREPINVLFSIGGTLAFGWFLVWIVTVGWVIDLAAGIILIATIALGILTGRFIYRFLSPTLYHWERVTIAAILGFAVALAFGELTHSHKLVNAYQHYSSDYDEN